MARHGARQRRNDKAEGLRRNPLPKLWQYNQEDITTWAYLDVEVGGTAQYPLLKWIKNPAFKFVGKYRPR